MIAHAFNDLYDFLWDKSEILQTQTNLKKRVTFDMLHIKIDKSSINKLTNILDFNTPRKY